jgi:hypothetical protein
MVSKSSNTKSSPAKLIAPVTIVAGVAIFFFGLYLFFIDKPTPVPLNTALMIIGFLDVVLSFYALRGSRAAWAFVTSLSAVLFVCTFFGAPSIRDATGLQFGVALLPALYFLVTTVLFSMAGEEY